MGFYSWDCRGCGESIKSPYNLPKELAWQNDAVAIAPSGRFQSGSYSGYGRICEHIQEASEVWHHKCWKEAGSLKEYNRRSDPAHDQGFFYDWPNNPND